MPCFVANWAVVSSPRSASSATFALNSAEYRFRLLVIQVRPSQERTELKPLSEFAVPPHAKGPSGNNRTIWQVLWPNRIVPFAVEAVANEVEGLHLRIGNRDASWIFSRIELAANAQPGLGGGGADEIDHDTVADQRRGAPVHADEGEQAMLDLVPLAGAGRQVVDFDGDAQFVSKRLQFAFPQPHAHAVAATTISGDDQTVRIRIALAADVLPPATDRLHREGGGIVVNPDTDPAVVRGQIIHAIGDRPAERLAEEVIDLHLFGLALRAPRPACVLEIPNQLLLLRIHRNHRLLLRQRRLHARIDVVKLRIAAGMLATLAGLAVALQAELLRLQHLGDDATADLVPKLRQFGRQPTQALAGPAQRRHRISAGIGLHQLQQVSPQRRVVRRQGLAAAAQLAHPPRCQRALRRQVLQAARDRARRNASGLRHRRNAAVTGCTRFRRRQQAACPLVEVRGYRREALTDLLSVDHPATLQPQRLSRNPPQSSRLFPDGALAVCV